MFSDIFRDASWVNEYSKPNSVYGDPLLEENRNRMDLVENIYEQFTNGSITAEERDKFLSVVHPDYLALQQGRDNMYGRTKLQEELEDFERNLPEDATQDEYLKGRSLIVRTYATPAEALVDDRQQFKETLGWDRSRSREDIDRINAWKKKPTWYGPASKRPKGYKQVYNDQFEYE